MSEALEAEYKAYLRRADEHLGEIAVGSYAKFRGRLVRKLPKESFTERWEQYWKIRQAYDQAMAQGDTVNDAVQQMLDEHTTELLLDAVAL